MRRMTYVICYDVADDDRRERMARLLLSRGQRVQLSVFELLSTKEALAALLRQATSAPYFDAAADRLRCYPLCAACREDAQVFGLSQPLAIPGSPLVL